ncbi:MAG: GH92 family glycosyl hydrolase [Planctomycetales bacterium]|nr:GH92 family glycosyl hydrolase [Planctomycetales bacterium]
MGIHFILQPRASSTRHAALPRWHAIACVLVILPSLLVATSQLPAAEPDRDHRLTDYVDPRIGTAHSRWFFFTPAAMPFGMAKLAPTTDGHLGNPSGWEAVGYDARHTSIEGFAHFHEFQIGGVVFAPTVGELQTVPGSLDDPGSGYRSRFEKQEEIAEPGYYSVRLKDYDIRAELTATSRVGLHRYTYPATEQARLILNIGTQMGESGPVVDASVTYADDGRIEGWVATRPAYVDVYQPGAVITMYFSARLDREPTSYGTFNGAQVFANKREQSGAGAGLYLTFDTRDESIVHAKVGLSYTSVANARMNLEQEARDLTFDDARVEAQRTWESLLGRVRVEGGSRADRVKFYTGLFHALLGRGLASDRNGSYPKNDGTVGQIPLDETGTPVHNHYNTDAVWGAFWNLSQLWALAYPEYYADWISSQLLVYRETGWLGDGIACSRYVSGVGTNFTGLLIAAAYNCGIRDYDIPLAWEATRKNELEGRGRPAGAGKLDVDQFLTRGYSPYLPELAYQTTPEGSGFAASHTLEYAFSASAAAHFAKQLGHHADAERLSSLADSWTNLFDDEVHLVRPRNQGGRFITPFDPLAPWIGFQEGNAQQYTQYVPHSIEQLISRVGRDTFNDRLDKTFVRSRADVFGGGKTIDAFAGVRAAYNHGNQPSLHMPGLFNFSGKPWLSQKWMRTICDEFYGIDGVHGYGYGQDEDQGQLGAWYVMASMGLFDVKGLTAENPSFQVVSPLFDRVTVHLNAKYYKGDAFVIETKNNSKANTYIQSLHLNGEPITSIQVRFADIVRGGRLQIELTSEPNRQLVD